MSEQETSETGQSQEPQESTIWDSPGLARFKSSDGSPRYDDVGKSYLELESMLGSRVQLPTAESTQEDWDKYYNRLRPESASAYAIAMPGVEDVDEEKLAGFKQAFHEAGLAQPQVDTIMRRMTQQIVDESRDLNQQLQEEQVKTEVALKNEWGANYEANKGMIQSMFREMGGEELHDSLAPLLNQDMGAAKFFLEAAQILRTSPVLKGEGTGNFGLMTVNEAEAEKYAILNDSGHPLYAAYHNRQNYEKRKPAIDRLVELNTVIAG